MAKRAGRPGGSFGAHMGLALLSSLLYRLSFPTPSISPIAWVALAPLLWVCARTTPGRAALCAAASGLLTGLISIPSFRFLTWAAYLAPVSISALYYALVGAGISRATRRGIPLLLAAPPIWTAYEFLRSVVPVIKFPWILAGHTQVGWIEMIQVMDLGGVYILTFVIISMNAYLAQIALERPPPGGRRRIAALGAIPLGLAAATLLYGVIRIRTIEEAPGPRIAIAQGNIPQEIKMTGMAQEILDEYMRLSRMCLAEDPSLIVWPETMYPWPLDPDELEEREERERIVLERLREDLFRIARRGNTRLLIGAIRTVEGDSRNSAFYISETGAFLGRYDKIDLVPLGEAVPFERSWPALYRFIRSNFLPPGYGQLQPGSEIPIFELEGSRFAVSICYEISFPNLVRRARTKGAGFLVSISNDAWFRDGTELDLAKDQAIFRAVENRIGIARAANTGISSFVDPTGRSVIFSRGGKRKQVAGILVRSIAVSSNGSLYTRIGDVFAWSMLLASLAVLLLKRRAPEQPPSGKSPTGKAP